MRTLRFTADRMEFVGGGRIMIAGRNLGDELRAGDRLKVWSKDSLESSAELCVDEITWYRRTVQAVESGHTAGLFFAAEFAGQVHLGDELRGESNEASGTSPAARIAARLPSPLGELIFVEQASMWLRCLQSSGPDVMLGGSSSGPADSAVQLAEQVLPFLDELTPAAGQYLDRFINRQVFSQEAEWRLEGIVVDSSPVKAPDQFGLCLVHDGDDHGSWTVIFRKLLEHERAHHQRFGWPMAFHREEH